MIWGWVWWKELSFTWSALSSKCMFAPHTSVILGLNWVLFHLRNILMTPSTVKIRTVNGRIQKGHNKIWGKWKRRMRSIYCGSNLTDNGSKKWREKRNFLWSLAYSVLPTICPFPIPCPMHLFIYILCNILYIKPANISVSLSSVSHFSKLIEPKKGVVRTPSFFFFFFFLKTGSRFVAQAGVQWHRSLLTVTLNSWTQVILLPQPPK